MDKVVRGDGAEFFLNSSFLEGAESAEAAVELAPVELGLMCVFPFEQLSMIGLGRCNIHRQHSLERREAF